MAVRIAESDTGRCRRFTAERTHDELLIMATPGELRAGGMQLLAAIVELGMDLRGAETGGAALRDATVEIVDSLPGGRPFLWLNRPDAVRLLVARGEMSEAGAEQLAEILSDGAVVERCDATANLEGAVSSGYAEPASGPPRPPQ
ncbi:hypothetical protein [Streptomyces sp. H39-S7]|uniref:hypothetical protein n=1 Tax=Streptomyces sp. H39-S7 TaxID=3004357 RepID=UPI0022AF03A7|nr:hypothetical protein [Streptomyces sp. H39-S7]MCZ4123365.1 hypothetical protein [Streptomyces sp. H39-S7]